MNQPPTHLTLVKQVEGQPERRTTGRTLETLVYVSQEESLYGQYPFVRDAESGYLWKTTLLLPDADFNPVEFIQTIWIETPDGEFVTHAEMDAWLGL